MDIKHYIKFWLSSPGTKKQIVTKRFNTIFDITYACLNDEGIKCIVFDVDDTITDHLGLVQGDTHKLLKRLIKKGINIAIYSNCSEERYAQLEKLFEEYDFYIVNEAKKPNPANYLKIAEHYGVKPENCAMVGDKIGSDHYGAYLAGYKERILIKPYSDVIGGSHGKFFPNLMRRLEKSFS